MEKLLVLWIITWSQAILTSTNRNESFVSYEIKISTIYIESKLLTHPLTPKWIVSGSPHSYVRRRVVGWISHTTATNELLLNNCLVRGVVGGGGCMTAAATPQLSLPYVSFRVSSLMSWQHVCFRTSSHLLKEKLNTIVITLHN